jgi:hypothetical protein
VFIQRFLQMIFALSCYWTITKNPKYIKFLF